MGLLFPGGFVGVDMFFVISGYVFTRTIRAEQQAASFGVGAFWIRRIRRLLPVALTMTATVLVIGCQLLKSNNAACFAASAMAQLACLSNIYFFIEL